MALHDGWEKADIASKVGIGVAGLALSIVLATGQCSEKSREEKLKLQQFTAEKENNYKFEFWIFYNKARDSSPQDELAKTDLDIAYTIAQILASDEFGKRYFLDACLALKTRLEFLRNSDANKIKQIPYGGNLQSKEAKSNSNIKTNPNEWFAVVGSFSNSRNGEILARNFANKNFDGIGCREIWKTAISPVYAVVIGGKTDRSTALAMAQTARLTGFATDAFTQVNRSWTQLTKCESNSG